MTSILQSACLYDATAEYYDLAYGEKAPLDVPFYLELAAACPGPVLELGCGTGRVGLQLARAGHRVVGLDLSPKMLAQFQAKLEGEPREVRERVELHEADMADFALGRKFSLILVPFRAFQHLLTPAAQRSCLTAVRRHLAPGGRFVYDAFNPNVGYIAAAAERGPSWRYDVDGRTADGGLVRRAYYANPDTGAQRHDLWFRYEEFDSDGTLTRTRVDRIPLRWQYRWEAQYLLELCGLRVVEEYGGYDRRPLDGGSTELLFVCEGM